MLYEVDTGAVTGGFPTSLEFIYEFTRFGETSKSRYFTPRRITAVQLTVHTTLVVGGEIRGSM